MKCMLHKILLLVFVAGLAACSSDESGGGAAVPTSHLSGVAAVGAPISGGTVALHCADGLARSVTSAASGAWSTRVPTAALPCAVQVSGGTVNGVANALTFYSLAFGSTGTAQTANITPLTDLALARAVNTAVGAALDAWFGGANLGTQLPQVVAGLEAARAALRTALTDAGFTLPAADFDPFTAAIAAGTATDVYDQLLEAYREALATAGKNYGDARTDYTAGAALPAAPATNTVDTTLAADESGARFATTGTVLGDSENQHVRFFTGAGSITVGATAGQLDEVTLPGPAANSYLNFRDLPDALGTYDCGYGFNDNKANIELGFAVSNGYSSMGTRGADGSFTPGFRCSITITKVGSRNGADYTGTIEGSFDAQLYKTGQQVNTQDSLSVTGHFRLGTAAAPPADADGDGVADAADQCPGTPAGTTVDVHGCAVVANGSGILGNLLKQQLAGDYVLKCSESVGQPVQTFAFAIAQNGSSTFKGAALVDAAHPGQVLVEGFASSASGVTVKFAPDAQDGDYVVLGFKGDGSFSPNSVYTNGKVLGCYYNTGNTAPASAAQTISQIPGVAGALQRTETLNCTKAGVTTAQALTINSDGSAQIGSESFTASQLFDISDKILFETNKSGVLSYSEVKVVNGQVSSRSLSVSVDGDRKTTAASFAVGLGPNDVSSCLPQ